MKGFILYAAAGCVLWAGLQLPAHAQEVDWQKKIVGSDMVRGSSLYSTVYTFPDQVDHFYLDRTHRIMQVITRGADLDMYRYSAKGQLTAFDLKEKKPMWNKKVRYANNAVYNVDGIFVQTPGFRTKGFDISTGKKKWKTHHDLYFIDEHSRIGVGYDTQGSRQNQGKLQGVDLDTGAHLWTRHLQHSFGWDDLYQLNDSVYLIQAEGLHTLNIHTGEGWSYYTRTGERAGAGLGAFGSGFRGQFQAGHMVSNIVYDSTDYYVASKEKIARIRASDGKVLWTSTYPDDMGSHSAIEVTDSLVYMVNKGIAASMFGPVKHGTPFLAAYDKRTGHPRYFTDPEDPEQPILGVHFGDDHIQLLTGQQVEKYHLRTGHFLLRSDIDSDLYGNPIQMLDGEEIFTKTVQGTFEPLVVQNEDLTFALCDMGIVVALNRDLQFAYTLGLDQLWLRYLEEGGYTFIADGERTMILDQAYYPVAEILAPGDAELRDGVLLYTIENQCYVLDLNEVLTESLSHSGE